jgi:hypothetical protein
MQESPQFSTATLSSAGLRTCAKVLLNLSEFSNEQSARDLLLNQSRKVSLNKVKIPTSISNLLRLKLGDTFQFFINHMIRHLNQVNRIQTAMKKHPKL